MGKALADAYLASGHEVVIVTGPVEVTYPVAAEIVPIISTEDMLEACLNLFPECDGLIGAAAPCDYRPIRVASHKLAKTGESLKLHLVETPDVVALCGAIKEHQWIVAFALETEDHRMRALQKLERKSADLIVLNGPGAIHAVDTEIEIIDPRGEVLAAIAGSKEKVAQGIVQVTEERLLVRN